MENKFRLTKDRSEILKVLNQKFQANSTFLVWQKPKDSNNAHERKFVTEAYVKSIDLIDGNFVVEVKESEKENFNPKLETYFLLKDDDFVFKTKQSIVQPISSKNISFQSPKEVRLAELRLCPRTYFDERDFKMVNVVFRAKNEIEESSEIKATCRIFNISKTGICIIITKETLSEINLKDTITIEGLSFFEQLENVKDAIVKNARVFSKKTIKSDESFAIGLEFQS